MNIWHDISDGRIRAEDFIAVIEVPKGSKKKYELDKETGMIRLDRVLYTSTQFPSNYGMIPRTLSKDGDPLDVLVLCSEELDPGVLVRCFPIGLIEMIDGGTCDEKIIAIPFKDPYFGDYTDVSELPKHAAQEIIHFLGIYKALEGGEIEVKPLKNRAEAVGVINDAKRNYSKRFDEEASLDGE